MPQRRSRRVSLHYRLARRTSAELWNTTGILKGLNRIILARVPAEHRRNVAAAQGAIQEIWCAALTDSIDEAYARGVKDERERQASVEKSGFDLGYKHGLDRAIGQVGQSARRVDEDDFTHVPS